MRKKTFVMIKPDGFQRKLVGNIISRFEIKGFDIINMKLFQPSKELAKAHYIEHQDKDFYDRITDYIASGFVVALVLEGPPDTVKMVRQMIGKTDPVDSLPGTIRGDLALSKYENIIHASDCDESAKREIDLWFKN